MLPRKREVNGKFTDSIHYDYVFLGLSPITQSMARYPSTERETLPGTRVTSDQLKSRGHTSGSRRQCQPRKLM